MSSAYVLRTEQVSRSTSTALRWTINDDSGLVDTVRDIRLINIHIAIILTYAGVGLRQEAQSSQGDRPNLEPDPTTLRVHHSRWQGTRADLHLQSVNWVRNIPRSY